MVLSEGLSGSALNVAALAFSCLFYLICFKFYWAGEFFVDIASAAFGNIVGGPALQGSRLFQYALGMVTDLGAANPL